MPNKITAIIPTRNEQDYLPGAVQSIAFADEILVVDAGSTDRTVAIAREHGASILNREFDDFSSQKNYAIEQAKHNWILVLDADERVSNELGKEIREAVQRAEEEVGFYVYRSFYFKGRRIRHGGWQTDKVVRLFRKDRCRYDGKLVHEQVQAEGKLAYLNNKLDHYSYRSFDHYASKLNQYAGLQAKELYRRNKRVTLFHLLIKPPFRFFVHYVIRMGFMDGIPGFILAAQHSFGVFTRYAKLWILRHYPKNP